jgi:hypothetical protein
MVRAGEQKAHDRDPRTDPGNARRSGGRPRRLTGGKLTGQKPALKEVWSIRARLELRKRVRDLAPFNLAIDSKLRACDLPRSRSRMSPQAAR